MIVWGWIRSTCASVLLGLAASAGEQETVRLEARVTTAAASSVYLDQGRQAGVADGDRVLLYPPGPSSVEATVRSVAKNSCRAELLPGSPPVANGVRAVIFIAKPKPADTAGSETERPAAEPAKPGETKPAQDSAPLVVPPPVTSPATQSSTLATTAPAHPPWTHPPETWNQDSPLLAPVFGQEPAHRPTTFTGRAYAQTNYTSDQQGNGRSYFLGLMGFDMNVDNPFGKGGGIDADAQVFRRTAESSGTSNTDDQFLLQRFSYHFGGTPEEPWRWEFGRFLQHEFPELGIVDGVETAYRTPSGSRFGMSAGGLPDPYTLKDTFTDLELAGFYRWVNDPDETFSLGGAYQNTWHDGNQDRNLFVGNLDLHPSSSFSLHSGVWVDYYDAADTIKSNGFELTELQIQGSYRFTPLDGLGLSLSHVKYPELLRQEFQSISPIALKENYIDRASLSGWYGIGAHVRLSGRADYWKDQNGDGLAGEVGVALPNLLYDRGEVAAAVFEADGSFSSGPGFRLSANRAFDHAFANLSYQFTQFDQNGFFGTQSTLAQQMVTGNLDFHIGTRWDLSLLGMGFFGDQQDAWTVGLFVQTRL